MKGGARNLRGSRMWKAIQPRRECPDVEVLTAEADDERAAGALFTRVARPAQHARQPHGIVRLRPLSGVLAWNAAEQGCGQENGQAQHS